MTTVLLELKWVCACVVTYMCLFILCMSYVNPITSNACVCIHILNPYIHIYMHIYTCIPTNIYSSV